MRRPWVAFRCPRETTGGQRVGSISSVIFHPGYHKLERFPMSLTRSPSPRPGGGWLSTGLNPGSGRSTPQNSLHPPSQSDPWLAAKAKSDEIRGYPSFSTKNNGFFSRSRNRISSTLPKFRASSRSPKGYSEKDGSPYGYGRNWRPMWLGRAVMRRRRSRILLALMLFLVGYVLFWTCELFLVRIP